MPPDYIRKQTIANGERYITPDLKEYETLVLNADERRLEIEQAHLRRGLQRRSPHHGAQLLRTGRGAGRAGRVRHAWPRWRLMRRYVRPERGRGRRPSRSSAGATRWWN
ncbi:MAG: hypothetical protein V9G19_11390 [Tetrasphaera sp.]